MIVVRTLGAAEIAVGDHLLKPTSTKKFALLLYLAAERGRHTTRAVLQDLLFPELPEKNARHALRELVYQLRQLGAPLDADNDGVGLRSEAVRSDYSEVMEAERLSDDQVRAVEGGFLPGYAPGHSESYSEWLDAQRGGIVSQICRRLLSELDEIKVHVDSPRKERIARACLALDPINERATRALAESLMISGSRAEANAVLANYHSEAGRALFVRTQVIDNWPTVAPTPDQHLVVGRTTELEAMTQRLDLAFSGKGRAIAVLGAAGIGKSSVLHAFSEIVRLRGGIVVESRNYPSDVSRPLSVLTDVLPQLIEAPGALGCSPESLDRLRALSKPNLAQPYEESLRGDRDITFACLRDLLEAITEERPLVLQLDDFQWVDPISRGLVEDILHVGLSRVLIVCAMREYAGGAVLTEHDRTAVVRLQALPPEAIRSIIRNEIPRSDALAEDWLCDSCGGNPLYLQLLIAQARTHPKARGLPPAMIDAIDGNIASLTPDARVVLLFSALLGRHANSARLLRLTSRGPLELTTAVEELVRSGLLPESGTNPPVPHRLIADRINHVVSTPARSTAIRCVADLLTNDAPGGGTALAWDAAHLWLSIGEREQGSRLIESCAAQTLKLGHARESAVLLREAARKSAVKDRERLLIAAASIAAGSSEADLVLDICADLRELTSALPEDILISELHARICWLHDYSALAQLLLLATDAPTLEQRRQAALELIRVADAQRDRGLAELAFSQVSEWLESDDCTAILRLRILITYHAAFGDAATAANLAREALRQAELMPAYIGTQLQRLAGVGLFRAGELHEAIAAWRLAYRTAEESRSTRSQFETAVFIATTAGDTGDGATAKLWNDAAERLIEQLPDLGNTLLWLAHQSDSAVCGQDIKLLLECRRRFAARASISMSRRARRWLRALDVHIDLLRNPSQIDDRTLRSLSGEQREGEETGDASDFEMSAILRIYLQRRAFAEGLMHLDRYLTQYRVYDAPLWSSLQQAAHLLRVAAAKPAISPPLL